jgi:urease gamma subunit
VVLIGEVARRRRVENLKVARRDTEAVDLVLIDELPEDRSGEQGASVVADDADARSERRDGVVPHLYSQGQLVYEIMEKGRTIHPNVENWRRMSPLVNPLWKVLDIFELSTIPPTVCTIAFGFPVVPDEYRTAGNISKQSNSE